MFSLYSNIRDWGTEVIPWPEEYYVGQKLLSLLDSMWRQFCKIAKMASFMTNLTLILKSQGH